MAEGLVGRSVAFLMANAGVEQAELEGPRDALTKAGARVVLVAPEKDTIQAFQNDVAPVGTFEADLAVADADRGDDDLLVLPGGTTDPDPLRQDEEPVAVVRRFTRSGKPVGAICRGAGTLVEADVERGKTLTRSPSVRTDIRIAGGRWRDEPVSCCAENGFVPLTSRNPGDIPAFADALVAQLAG